MTRGVRLCLVGSLVLVALAACKQSWLEEREPWRREAEVECLKTGTVKESPSVALLGPINGPGMCGADFPLKVAALGENPVLSYADEPLRPPGQVPQGGGSYPRPVYAPAPTYQPPPQYPDPAPRDYPSNSPFSVNPAYPADTRLPPNPDYRSAPAAPPPRYQQQYPQNYPPASQYPSSPYPPPAPQYSSPPPYVPPAPYRPAQPTGPNSGPISLTPP